MRTSRFYPQLGWLALAVVTLLGARTARATDLLVTNNADSGSGSLRQSLQTNASLGGGNRVLFSNGLTGAITLTSGELVIDRDVTIAGSGHFGNADPVGITVSGNNTSRVMRVTGSSTVTISNLTIANGNTTSFGAGVYVDFGSTLTLSRCTVSGNTSGNTGGGVANNGSFTAEHSTFSGNSAAFGGGGIYTYAGPVVLRNCTVMSNSSGFSCGGGLCNYSLVAGTSNHLTSTIVAGNSGAGHADVIGVFTSGGYNLVGQIDYSTPTSGNTEGVPTSGLNNGLNHDQAGTIALPINALTGPLRDNGGPTLTHALKPGSPAVDKGSSPGQSTDQRGAPRPFDFPSIANAAGGDASDIGAFELSPPVDINFTAARFADTNAYPPNTAGVVGPTQFVVAIEGRIRSFNKETGLADGALNVDPDIFFASVKSSFVGNPQLRFDRLSRRWFLVMIDAASNPANRILIAVSDGPVITGSASFSFFSFRQDQASPAGDVNGFADLPSLGIDNNALYVGVNIFTNGVTFAGTTAFVIRKSSLLEGGPMVVTAFRGLTSGPSGEGPFAPKGVDNFDPGATEGYLIGESNQSFDKLVLRRISDPGGTPGISGNILVPIPQWKSPLKVPHLGNTGSTNGQLNGGDGRLAMAQIRNGRLWTTHTVAVNNTGGGAGTLTRNAARWYELDSLDTTPTLRQSGTVYSSSPTNDTAQKHFFFSSLMVSGQGHAAMGFSTAGTNDRANAGFASRLAGDPAGFMKPPIDYTASTTAYNPSFDPGGVRGRLWGLYSYTSLDPEDDMTMWTIQEFCDSPDSFGVRVAKLFAPPPATPISLSPATIPAGRTGVDVVVTGAAVAGSGFFDPGPGFAKRLAASASGGIMVNNVTYHSPTSLTLNLNTMAASTRNPHVTIFNPDGQSLTATGLLSVLSPPTLNVATLPGRKIRLFWNHPPELAGSEIETLEQSGDLVTWEPANGTIANPTPGNFEIVLNTDPGPRRFFRVRVTAQ